MPFDPLKSFAEGAAITRGILDDRAKRNHADQMRDLKEHDLMQRLAISEMNRDAASQRSADILKAAEDRITSGEKEREADRESAKDKYTSLLGEKITEFDSLLSESQKKRLDAEQKVKDTIAESDKKVATAVRSALLQRKQKNTDLQLRHFSDQAKEQDELYAKMTPEEKASPHGVQTLAHAENFRRQAGYAEKALESLNDIDVDADPSGLLGQSNQPKAELLQGMVGSPTFTASPLTAQPPALASPLGLPPQNPAAASVALPTPQPTAQSTAQGQSPGVRIKNKQTGQTFTYGGNPADVPTNQFDLIQ